MIPTEYIPLLKEVAVSESEGADGSFCASDACGCVYKETPLNGHIDPGMPGVIEPLDVGWVSKNDLMVQNWDGGWCEDTSLVPDGMRRYR